MPRDSRPEVHSYSGHDHTGGRSTSDSCMYALTDPPGRSLLFREVCAQHGRDDTRRRWHLL